MAKEDILLREEMGKLEIEATKPMINAKDENPFIHQPLEKCFYKKTSTPNFRCPCSWSKKYKAPAIYKKKNNKIIKEPILKLLQRRNVTDNEKIKFQEMSPENLNSDILSVCVLVDNCNQLKISSHSKKDSDMLKIDNDNHTKWWTNDTSQSKPTKKSIVETNQTGSCSQQALNPPCDVTIDELASYFETLVHIPKKMSSMAEMMYI